MKFFLKRFDQIYFESQNFEKLTTFAQVCARPKTFFTIAVIGFDPKVQGLTDGPVKCANACDSSKVILIYTQDSLDMYFFPTFFISIFYWNFYIKILQNWKNIYHMALTFTQ